LEDSACPTEFIHTMLTAFEKAGFGKIGDFSRMTSVAWMSCKKITSIVSGILPSTVIYPKKSGKESNWTTMMESIREQQVIKAPTIERYGQDVQGYHYQES